MQAIQRAFDTTSKDAASAQLNMPIQLQMTGPGVFSVQSRDSIRRDAIRLSTIATLLAARSLVPDEDVHAFWNEHERHIDAGGKIGVDQPADVFFRLERAVKKQVFV